MAEVMDKLVESQPQAAARRFTSPNRILARSFRLSRDKWKQKHHQVQAKLEQTRQLAVERGIARDRWRERCEQATARAATAEASAARLQGELEQARTRIAALEAALQKKRADAARSGPERSAGARLDAVVDHRRMSPIGSGCGSSVCGRCRGCCASLGAIQVRTSVSQRLRRCGGSCNGWACLRCASRWNKPMIGCGLSITRSSLVIRKCAWCWG